MTNTASTEGELRQLILNNAANYGSAQVIWAAVDRYAATMAREELEKLRTAAKTAGKAGDAIKLGTLLVVLDTAIAALASPDGEKK